MRLEGWHVIVLLVMVMLVAVVVGVTLIVLWTAPGPAEEQRRRGDTTFLEVGIDFR